MITMEVAGPQHVSLLPRTPTSRGTQRSPGPAAPLELHPFGAPLRGLPLLRLGERGVESRMRLTTRFARDLLTTEPRCPPNRGRATRIPWCRARAHP